MSAVVIRPGAHVLKCQAKYGFVLAEQLDNSARGAGGVKADCRRDAVGREPASAAVSHDAKQAISSRRDDSMTTRDGPRIREQSKVSTDPGNSTRLHLWSPTGALAPPPTIKRWRPW